jgi:hypothetical protein
MTLIAQMKTLNDDQQEDDRLCPPQCTFDIRESCALPERLLPIITNKLKEREP